jgi:predicted glycoside hydrolase/deacetylase ChbG (UPF0249 family)
MGRMNEHAMEDGAGILAPAGSRKRIVLCVDDFGLHEGVNTSVLMLMALGRLGAVSALVDAAAIRSAAERLQDGVRRGMEQPDIGLHLNLSERFAVSDAPASGFAEAGVTQPAAFPYHAAMPGHDATPGHDAIQQDEEGVADIDVTPLVLPEFKSASGGTHRGEPFHCMPLPKLIASAYARTLDPAAMRTELHRQCRRFERLFQRRPDFVDGHQHVHQLPVVREALLNVLTARYGWQRPWLRSTSTGAGNLTPKAHLIAALGQRALARLAREKGFAQNRHLLGVHGFTTDPMLYQQRLERWLKNSVEGDLLMCHPSTWSASPGDLLVERMAEHDVLTGLWFERRLKAANVALVHPQTLFTSG